MFNANQFKTDSSGPKALMELLEAKDSKAFALADVLNNMSHTSCNVNLCCFPASSATGEVADMLSPSLMHMIFISVLTLII